MDTAGETIFKYINLLTLSTSHAQQRRHHAACGCPALGRARRAWRGWKSNCRFSNVAELVAEAAVAYKKTIKPYKVL